MTQMNPMDELDLTRRALGDEEPDPRERRQALARIRTRLDAAIETERFRRRPARRLVPPIAAAILAIGLVVLIALGLPFGRPAAADELRRLAAIAAGARGPVVGPGEFLLMRSEEFGLQGQTYLDERGIQFAFNLTVRLRVETWFAADGSGVHRTRWLSADFASERDRRVWIEAGSHPVPEAGDELVERFAPGEGRWIDLSALPTSPGRLLADLRAGRIIERAPGDDQVFLTIGELLARADAPPAVRAALFEAAARLDGVELMGEDADPLGREGVALAIQGTTRRTELIFDPDSARLLAHETYLVRSDGSVGPIFAWTAVQGASVVDSAPEPDPPGIGSPGG
jgi:hypothetical protein